jgi:hypothetical protein
VISPFITDILGRNGLAIVPGSTTSESNPSTTGTGKPGDMVTLFDGQQVIGSAGVDAPVNGGSPRTRAWPTVRTTCMRLHQMQKVRRARRRIMRLSLSKTLRMQ